MLAVGLSHIYRIERNYVLLVIHFPKPARSNVVSLSGLNWVLYYFWKGIWARDRARGRREEGNFLPHAPEIPWPFPFERLPRMHMLRLLKIERPQFVLSSLSFVPQLVI